MTNDDKINYTITKSKSHFGLFVKTVNNAFKHVRERPEVYGMDTFLQQDPVNKQPDSYNQVKKVNTQTIPTQNKSGTTEQ